MSEPSRGVRAVSRLQRDAWNSGRLPPMEDLGAGLWSIPLSIPEGNLPGTLAYALLGEDGVHLIDPGWGSVENERALDRALHATGGSLEDVETIIVTHHHPDHLGLAPRLRRRSGARIVMSASERAVLASVVHDSGRAPDAYRETLIGWGVPSARHAELIAAVAHPPATGDVEPDATVGDGDVLQLAGRRLEVVSTPGHTGGHICLVDRSRRMLFSGDHVLPRVYSGVGIGILPGTDPLGDLLASLERLAEFDDYEVLPGHEYRFTGLGPRREQIARHHMRRAGEVAALVPDLGDAPVWAYAARLTWTSGWEGLAHFWLHSALRQTELYLQRVRHVE